ncbi:hypothetical protein ANCCAN_26289 [Ancylostoma caninum]|uniref:SCP domain-containing protein n=1 Tax=Ancylostoma caninum TaxID=29170 RepID=A0A368F7A9_ANCCA|nr:hypothetical protein ANCCAN_26289 [Ancylostoma caninum]
MLSVGIFAAFCLFPMILGSAPECDDDELAYSTDIKNLVAEKVKGRMPSNPSYDCALQSQAQQKFDLLDEDGEFKVVDKGMSDSKEDFVTQTVENWSQKLATMSSTKFGCTYTERDHEGTPTKRLLGCVFD